MNPHMKKVFAQKISKSLEQAMKSTSVTMSVDNQAGTPSATRPRTMVTKRKARPKRPRKSAPANMPMPPPSLATVSLSSNLSRAISLRKSEERSAVRSLMMVPSERSDSASAELRDISLHREQKECLRTIPSSW